MLLMGAIPANLYLRALTETGWKNAACHAQIFSLVSGRS